MNRTEKKEPFRGLGTALVTPFSGGEPDYEAWERLIRFQLDRGTDCLVVCGTTGEAPTLTREEKKRLISSAVSLVSGQVPVVAGAGSNSTLSSVLLAADAREAGADALLVVTPYYNKGTESGLIAHYREMGRVGLPLLLYHVPGRTGVTLTAAQIRALLRVENVSGIKEASGNMRLTEELLAGGDDPVYCGSDELNLPALFAGCAGLISVTANVVPDRLKEMVTAVCRSDKDKARQIDREVLPLSLALFSEVNPVPVKYALSRMGLIREEMRLPLTPASEKTRVLVDRAMEALL